MSTRRIFPAIVAPVTLVTARVWRSAEAPQLKLTARPLSEVQRSTSKTTSEATQPTVALVLGDGGRLGFAHVGVLRAFDEAGIQPAMVFGTSAGAVIGAAYASGMSSRQIARNCMNLGLKSNPGFRGNLAEREGFEPSKGF